jgi:hypothetical protein
MPTFLLTHHFPENFQGTLETAAAATAWLESLEPHLLTARPTPRPNGPAFETRRLGTCGTEPAQLAHTLISADNLEAAAALAEGWPLLARGGGVEVRELTLKNSRLQASA